MDTQEESATTLRIWMSILSYSICSSTLLLANKMTVEFIPSPAAVSFIQITFTSMIVVVIKSLGYKVDWFDMVKLKAYGPYVVLFVATLYANMKALTYTNVETVIVFRACTPIAVSIVDYLLLGRMLPGLRSSLSMLILAISAIVYCYSESGVSLNVFSAYMWVSIYFVLVTIEMTYGKMLTSSVKMESVWGPVLYCNFLSIIPMGLIGMTSETSFFPSLLSIFHLSFYGSLVLLFGCVVGTAIGCVSWDCRAMISAATFTMVGVVNKFLTILLNVLVWEKHSTPVGLGAVCVCLIAGCFYQQAPMIEPIQSSDESNNNDEESEKSNFLCEKNEKPRTV